MILTDRNEVMREENDPGPIHYKNTTWNSLWSIPVNGVNSLELIQVIKLHFVQ